MSGRDKEYYVEYTETKENAEGILALKAAHGYIAPVVIPNSDSEPTLKPRSRSDPEIPPCRYP